MVAGSSPIVASLPDQRVQGNAQAADVWVTLFRGSVNAAFIVRRPPATQDTSITAGHQLLSIPTAGGAPVVLDAGVVFPYGAQQRVQDENNLYVLRTSQDVVFIPKK
jgi:hypothetical protein